MHFMYKTPNMNMKREFPFPHRVPHNVQQDFDQIHINVMILIAIATRIINSNLGGFLQVRKLKMLL